MKKYLALNSIELEPQPDEPGYYLPHHAVVREDAVMTKVRVVFNASAARKGGTSLNNVLHLGPSLLADIVGMLLQFRKCSWAGQGDIRKAFFGRNEHGR